MIRKFSISIMVIFSLIWFGSAYLIKAKLSYQLQNLEMNNIELSYKRITIAGFPNIWKVKIKEPKLKFVNHLSSKEISTNEIECVFDLSFKKANLIINDRIIQEEDFGQQKDYHYLNSVEPVLISLKFNKPFYKFGNQDRINDTLKSLKLNNLKLEGTRESEKIFSIDNLNLSLSQGENTHLKIKGNYSGQNYLLGFNSASLSFDSTINYLNNAEKSESTLVKIFKLNDFVLNIDEDSGVNVNGSIENYIDKLPQGQFIVNLSNYTKIIDKLVNHNFIIPKSALKKIIAQTFVQNKSDDNIKISSSPIQVAFKIQFSEAGVKVAEVNSFNINKANTTEANEINN